MHFTTTFSLPLSMVWWSYFGLSGLNISPMSTPKVLRWTGVGFLMLVLIFLRPIGAEFLYDPLKDFFHNPKFRSLPLPEIELTLFSISITIKYLINSILSILIIWLLFLDKELVKLSAVLFGLFYVVLLTVLIIVLRTATNEEYLLLFYLRRILYHPLLLLLLVPAFYFY